MKTAISVPDHLYAEAQRLTRKLKKSRSQLYSEALAEYIARHDDDEVTEAMNRVCDEVDPDDKAWLAAAARRVLQRAAVVVAQGERCGLRPRLLPRGRLDGRLASASARRDRRRLRRSCRNR